MPVNMSELINERSISFIPQTDKRGVLDALTDKAAALGFLADPAAFRAAIDTRETIGSTAVGDAVAIPHATVPGMGAFFVMTGVVRPAVDWDALDQKPVSLVFLIGVPAGHQTDYLNLLGKILKEVKDPGIRNAVLKAQNVKEVVALLG